MFLDLLVLAKKYKIMDKFFFCKIQLIMEIVFLFFNKKKSDFFVIQFLAWLDSFKIFDYKIYFIPLF